MLLSRLLLIIVPLVLATLSSAQNSKKADDENSPENQRRKLDYEIWDLMDSALELFGPGQTWYELFGLSESSASTEIQTANRRMSIRFHPDKNPGDEVAAKKYATLAGMNKILRDPETRRRYDHWMQNGVPMWRGQGYYFRKSENLSLIETAVVILLFGALMQYALLYAKYRQVKAGLALIEEQRKTAAPTSGSGKKLKKGASGDKLNLKQSRGIFDDSNKQAALNWLVMQNDIHPDVIFDAKEWDAMITEDFGGDFSVFDAKFPSLLSTYLFTLPASIVRSIVGGKKKEGQVQKDD
eukprot:Partr_v1_DN27886_c0_g1_i2_m22634 putative DnaJ (Hsp40) homolog, subfamily C, member 1